MSAMLAGLQANFIKRVLTSQPQIQLLPPDEVARPLRNAPGHDRGADRAAPDPARASRSTSGRRSAPRCRRGRTSCTRAADRVGLGAGGARRHQPRDHAVPASSRRSISRSSGCRTTSSPATAQLTSEDILIGTELASDLGASLGDKLNVTTPLGGNRILTITGIFDLGNKGANQRNTFVALRTAQSLLDLIGGVTIDRPHGHRHLRRRDHRAGDPGDAAGAGRQLDQDQRAVLHRGAGAADLQHADPRSSSACRSRSASPRAGRLGDPALQGHRHPARDGHARAARSCACS